MSKQVYCVLITRHTTINVVAEDDFDALEVAKKLYESGDKRAELGEARYCEGIPLD